MFDIKTTINGRTVTNGNFKSEIEKVIIGRIKDHIQNQLENIQKELNGEMLTVEIIGSDLDNLSVRLSGPDELVEQAKEALGAE